jgi:hypothetical protein
MSLLAGWELTGHKLRAIRLSVQPIYIPLGLNGQALIPTEDFSC